MPIRFGPFQFDPKNQELRKHSLPVRMSASQTRLLRLFLDRPGELITREEITKCLWTETGTIDVATGINTAIRRLRYNLNDDPARPEYLETMIGVGYRFIAQVVDEPPPVPVEAILPKSVVPVVPSLVAVEEVPSQPLVIPAPPERRRGGWWRWVLAGGVISLLVAAGFSVHWLRRTRPAPAGTAAKDWKFEPVTFDVDGNKVVAAAVAPDGRSVAYADDYGISIHWFAARPDELAVDQPNLVVHNMAWLHGPTMLAVSGTDRGSGRHEVWAIGTAAYNHLLLEDAELATVSPDGTHLAFTRGRGSEIWVSSQDGSQQRRLASLGTAAVSFLQWSRSGQALLLSASEGQATAKPSSGAGWFYASVDAQSGSVIERRPGIRIDSGFQLADGTLHYIATTATESEANTDWLKVPADPSTGKLLGSPTPSRKIQIGPAKSLSASLDGTRITAVFDRRNQAVFSGALTNGGAKLGDIRRVSHGLYNSYPHAWNRNREILFETLLHGKSAIFAQSPGAGDGRLVAQVAGDAFYPQLTPDGQWILFLEQTNTSPKRTNLYRVAAAGGEPQRVPTSGELEEIHCPLAGPGPCVVRASIGREVMVYYALDPVQGMGKEVARTAWRPNRLGDWNVSPDGATLSVIDHSHVTPAIDLIPIDGSGKPVRHFSFTGHGAILAASWAADAKGLFIETRTDNGFQLVYASFSGKQSILIESPRVVFGVPSADGKTLAFPRFTQSENVWTVTQQ